ncbi:MAG: cation transporter [Pirellulaceae bacterium]|nr:cation transporter [Pirellulaceae bacterium]
MDRKPLEQNTLLGFMASIVLAGIKFAAGLFGHSTALLADAIESLADTLGSLLVWHALRVAARPADPRYPYGYGKAEALASLGIGSLLVLAALYIVYEGFHQIAIPHAAPESWTLLVLVIIIVVKEGLFRLVHRGAQQFDSDAARADAWHHRSDAITSLAAFVGVSLAIYGPDLFGWPQLVIADEVAAILASGVILLTARSLIIPAMRELLDAATPAMATRIATLVSQVEGVEDVEQVLVRKSGTGFLADMHMHVPGELSVQVAHDLTGKIKAMLRQEIPSLVTILIHVEPAVQAGSIVTSSNETG